MNSKERVLTTFNHEEPDRVPIFESSIDSIDVLRGYNQEKAGMTTDLLSVLKLLHYFPFWTKTIKFLANRRVSYRFAMKRLVKLFQRIGVDLFTAPLCLFPIGKSAGFGLTKPGLKTPRWSNMVDEYGRMFSFYESEDSDLRLMNYIGGIFDSPTGNLEEIIAKYEKWAPLDANIKARYYSYEEALKLVEKKEGPFIIPGIGGFLEVTWESMGFENYVKLLYEHPDFIEEVTKKNAEFSRALVENLINRYPIELLIVFDDQGYKTGPFLSPQKYNQLIYPHMKSLVKYCHDNGVKVILHSCGNLNKILDKIMDTGIDGLNPLEPAASMDIFQIKRDYDRVTLIGNVDPIHLLAKGTPKDVADYVKKIIKYCAPGGGLIMASGHSINPSVSFANYNSMIQTTREYGTYPIKIED